MDDVTLLRTIVEALVDNPQDVRIERTVDEQGVLITLAVAQGDMGKIIGRKGRNAGALRQVMRVFGLKNKERINVKVLEPEGEPK